MSIRVLAFIDTWLHRLRVPHRMWRPLCDAYDIALGVPDTPENFPRRHGYVRLSHQASGTWSSRPENLYCDRCGHVMTSWDSHPCVLVKPV